MPVAPPRYWAFLSYSSHDRGAAIWLQRTLETYRVPRRLVGRPTPAGPAPRRFRPIFRDGSELAADPDLVARIAAALEQSAYLIVLCSPEAARSHWVDDEITRFKRLHGEARILSVILEGSPQEGPQSCFPAALRYRTASADLSEKLVPIAADLRPHGDGRRRVRLKLLAGMLGVGLDELVRREAQRRLRRWMAVAAVSLVALVITGALALSAFFARNEALRQRAQAEGLIEFMLTDLRKRLEPSGRLSAMDGVGPEALKYYEAQDPAALDAQSLARRARALRLMGEITVERGDLGEALRSFDQAAATTAELLARAPTEGQRIFNHAQNVFWVGEIARQRGDLARAESSFQRYRALANQLLVMDPNNDDWRTEVSYAESALGTLYIQEGRTADARASFERSLGAFTELARRNPSDLNRQFELGQGHAWLADALQKLGRLAEARDHNETELQIYRILLAKDGTMRQPKFSTVDVLQTLGHLAMLEGNAQGALDRFKESAERAEALLAGEPENMNTTGVAASAQVALGETLLTLGKVDDARVAQRRASTLLVTALSHDDTVAIWHDHRDEASLLEAKIYADQGQAVEALKLDQAVLSRLSAGAGPSVNTQPFWLLQSSRLQTGDDLAALGRSQDAKTQWTTVVNSLSGPLDHYEPRLLKLLAEAQTRLGRTTEAQVVTTRLQNLFRPIART